MKGIDSHAQILFSVDKADTFINCGPIPLINELIERLQRISQVRVTAVQTRVISGRFDENLQSHL